MALEADAGTPPAETPAAEPELSLAEHEAQFHDGPTPPDPNPEPEEDPRRPPRERDDKGQFKPPRHRAASQQASKADVPRIQELTKKLREAETERDALRARPAPALETAGAPSAEPAADRARNVPRETPPAATAKPKIDDFQEYGDYVEALADWKIAEARKQDRETSQRESEARQLADSWRRRVDDAKTRHPDFEQVALLAPTSIPQGSLVDAWILEHRSGADVLYTLQQDPGELRRILALPMFDQVEALTLLGQRMVPTREPAVKTGAAATSSPRPAPRPPTPVRSGAMPAADEPPGDDASIASHEKFYYRDRHR